MAQKGVLVLGLSDTEKNEQYQSSPSSSLAVPGRKCSHENMIRSPIIQKYNAL